MGVAESPFASVAMQFPERKRHLPKVTRGLKQHTFQAPTFHSEPLLGQDHLDSPRNGRMLLDILPGSAWNGIKYLSVIGGLQRTFEMDCVFMRL